MDVKMIHSGSTNPDLLSLVRALDEDLNGRYGLLQGQYNAYNSLQGLDEVLLLYADGQPAACGAYKRHDNEAAEIKRVFVAPQYRRKGFARKILASLEQSATQNGYHFTVLETGVRQSEAIGLYRSCGYEIIENYGQYAGNSNSVCMRKKLIAG